MTAIKERLIGAITVMNATDAEKLWNIIQQEFTNQDLWDSIKEVQPTEEELEIINAYKNGEKQYQPYMDHEEIMNQLGLDK